MSAADPAETIAITECKAHFLRLADQVARTGRVTVIARPVRATSSARRRKCALHSLMAIVSAGSAALT